MKTEISNEKFAEFWQYLEKHGPNIESALLEHLPLAPPNLETRFNEACEHVLASEGKRIRPILTMLGAELVGGNPDSVVPAAAAVEFVQISTDILDDLPGFNQESASNASVRSQFGEGLAMMVAIGFLNAAYPLVFVNHTGMPERAMQAHAEIVECVGASGMIGGRPGQFPAKGVDDDFPEEPVRDLKSSAIMRLALRIGAILGGATYMELAQLSRFAELLGDAYQLSEDLNKRGQDAEVQSFLLNQSTSSSQIQLINLVEEAGRILVENFPSNNARSCLIQLTEYLKERHAEKL